MLEWNEYLRMLTGLIAVEGGLRNLFSRLPG